MSVRCEICHIKLQMEKPNQGSTSTNIVLNSFLINRKTVLLFMHIQYAIVRAGKTGSCWLCHSSNLPKNYQKQNSELFSPVKSISFHFVLTFCSKFFYLFNDYYARLMPNHMKMDHFDQIVFSKRQLSSAVSWRFCENESGTSKILYFYFLSQRKFVFNRVLPSI